MGASGGRIEQNMVDFEITGFSIGNYYHSCAVEKLKGTETISCMVCVTTLGQWRVAIITRYSCYSQCNIHPSANIKYFTIYCFNSTISLFLDAVITYESHICAGFGRLRIWKHSTSPIKFEPERKDDNSSCNPFTVGRQLSLALYEMRTLTA